MNKNDKSFVYDPELEAKRMRDFEAMRKRLCPNPRPGFRSLGDELSGHEAMMVTIGLQAAAQQLTDAMNEPEAGESVAAKDAAKPADPSAKPAPKDPKVVFDYDEEGKFKSARLAKEE